MFEKYLQEQHAKIYMGHDDDMPEAFEHWLENMPQDRMLEYGNQMAEEMEAAYEKHKVD